MKKDLFIDNNIASKFCNPQDKEYIKLTKWLLHFDPSDKSDKDNYAHLVVSQKLLIEYLRSSQNTNNGSAIPLIIDLLIRDGRLIKITNQQIKDFKSRYYTKRVENSLTCNNEDRDLLPVVFLSDRKFALTYDKKFKFDLENFPGFNVRVEKRPEELPYDK